MRSLNKKQKTALTKWYNKTKERDISLMDYDTFNSIESMNEFETFLQHAECFLDNLYCNDYYSLYNLKS